MLPRVAPLLLAVATCVAGSGGHEARALVQAELRVLVVGNSYTYYNNLPEMLEALAAADPGAGAIAAERVGAGGLSLQDHLERDETLAAIRDGDWDAVVLQAQSTFGRTHLVDGRFRAGDASGFREAARALDRLVRESGARTVLLQHWRRRDNPPDDGDRIAHAFMEAGRELGAAVAPVGLAFEEARVTPDAPELYADDGSHPSPAGTYLVDLDDPQAAALQEAARVVTARLAESGGHLEVPDPGPPEAPVLPPARPVAAAELEGTWRGPLTVYPYAATLVLELDRAGGEWVGRARVEFGGRPDDIVIDMDGFEVTSEGIRFVDPDGPNGGRVEYRGVWAGRGLAGIAEIIVPDAPIYGVGSWRLARYSRPRISAGSSRAARSAGSQAAGNAVAHSTRRTDPSVGRSRPATSSATAATSRSRSRAPIDPATSPAPAAIMPLRMTSERSSDACAPRASRTPISPRRSLATYATTP